MAIEVFIPHQALQPYVKYYAHIKVHPAENEDVVTMDFFPNGISALVFNLNDEPKVEDLIEGKDVKATFTYVGQFDTFSSYKCRKANFIIVNFTELGAYYLFNNYQTEFRNAKTEMCDIFPRLQSFIQQLQDHRDDIKGIVRLIDTWLLSKVSGISTLDYYKYQKVVHYIKRHHGVLPITQLCEDIGISMTSLEDHFKQKLGLTPKMFCRIIRFNNCLKLIESQSQDKRNWLDIAYQFNYFDQMHFIRDFKRFFGYTPSNHQLSQWNISKMMMT